LYCTQRQGRGSKYIKRIRIGGKGSKKISLKRKKGKDNERLNVL